jgi:LPS sulfotransferase NodH
MKTEKNKKQALLEAFDKSETKRPTEACRIAGVVLSTYYFHTYRDPTFRQAVLKIQAEHTLRNLASV